MGEKYLINIVEKENPANQNSFIFIFFLLKIKFDITLNIHIYELIKQTLVKTHRKLTKCRESDSTTNQREAWEASIL